MAASISVNLLGTILHCWHWVVACVQNGLCPYHSTIFTSQTRWLDPGCLQETAPPRSTPVQEGCRSPLAGRLATPCHCLIYHIGVTCGSTPGKSGEMRGRRELTAKKLWGCFLLFSIKFIKCFCISSAAPVTDRSTHNRFQDEIII